VKYFDWDSFKNIKLKSERGVSFEDILSAIEGGKVLDDLEHPNQGRYPGQRILVVDFDGYAHLIPYVEDEVKIFLKTIIPSRKATKEYLQGGNS
jgi:hypothetical protein